MYYNLEKISKIQVYEWCKQFHEYKADVANLGEDRQPHTSVHQYAQ